MGVGQLSSFTVTLGGTPLSMIADPRQQGNEDRVGYSGTFSAQDATRTLVKRDVPLFLRRLSRGAGFVKRRDAADDGGYAWTEDGITWLDNGWQPAGRRQRAYTSSVASNAYIIDSVEFNGHLWFLTSYSQIIRIPNADPAQVPVVEPPSGLPFNGGTAGFRSGYFGESIAVFADASGTPAIYVGTYNPSTGATRVYQYTVGGGWTESGVMGFRVSALATVYWTGRDAVGALRLVAKVADSTIRHVISGNDPLNPASYVTPIIVGNPAYSITRLLAYPQHLFVLKTNGIHDVNELRAPNLTDYWQETASQATVPTGYALLGGAIYDEHVYGARGFGLDRYPVRLQGDEQRIPGECGPMAFMQDGTPIRGYIMALGTHGGWLLGAVYNPDTQVTYVGRAKDRRILNVDVPNPLVWHMAETVIRPTDFTAPSGVFGVTYLKAVSKRSSAVFNPPNEVYLWLCSAYATGGGPTQFTLDYVPLPTGSGPLSLQVSGGTFQAAATARLFLTAQNWDDGTAHKPILAYDLEGETVTATSTLEVRSRVDGDPRTITDQTTWKSEGTATANSTTIVPATTTSGKSIQNQIVATTPSPYTAPPIFRELSPRAAIRRRTFQVRQVWFVLERDYELDYGPPDIRDPDTTFDTVTALQNADPTSYVDEQGRSYTVLVEQGTDFDRVDVGDGEWRTVMRAELTLVA
jgi:hypothetical protein